MIHDGIKLKGRLKIEVTGPDGNVIDTKEVDNLVVTDGKEYVASRMAGTSASVMSHMAIGDNSTAAAVGQSELSNEVARVSLTSTSVNDNDVVYVATFPANTPSTQKSVVEAGIFNGGSTGTMLCRTVFGTITKSASDSLTITWTVSAS